MVPKIIASDFVKRQVPGSAFSHSTKHSFEDIERMTTEAYLAGHYKNGPRDGVILVQIPSDGFVSGIVKLNTSKNILARFKERKEGESPYLQVSADGERLPGEQVDIVLYSREALLEGQENSDLSADYEIVSINVAPLGGAPMDPYTMARNQLVERGGTKATYDSDTWAKSVKFWATHAHAMPKKVKRRVVFEKILKFLGIAMLVQLSFHIYRLFD